MEPDEVQDMNEAMHELFKGAHLVGQDKWNALTAERDQLRDENERLREDIADRSSEISRYLLESSQFRVQRDAAIARAEAAERERDEAQALVADLRGALDDLLPPRREHLTEPERRAYAVLDAMIKEATNGR